MQYPNPNTSAERARARSGNYANKPCVQRLERLNCLLACLPSSECHHQYGGEGFFVMTCFGPDADDDDDERYELTKVNTGEP